MAKTESEYWTNRKAGKRGQGEYPSLIMGMDVTPATSARGLKMRKKKTDRPKTPYQEKWWEEAKQAIRERVARREGVAKSAAWARKESRDERRKDNHI